MALTRRTDVNKQRSGLQIHAKREVYQQDETLGLSAKKKDAICKIIGEGTQLSVLATIVDQIATKIGLDTPELTEARQVWADIQAVLNDDTL